MTITSIAAPAENAAALATAPGTILVTGATGFIGRALCHRLRADGWRVIAAIREGSAPPEGCEGRLIDDLRGPVDWRAAVAGIDAVAHLAGFVHAEGKGDAQMTLARKINVDATLSLALAAVAAGAKRFLYASSTKIYGDADPGQPFDEDSPPHPANAYGVSKLEAEQGLARISAENGLAVTVLRLPLVHGPGVKANMRRLVDLCDSPWSPPLGRADYPRSLLGLDNLCDAMVTALTRPPAGFAAYVLRDPEDVTISDLLRLVRERLGRSTWLAPAPNWLIRLGARMLRREDVITRLLSPLRVDDRRVRAAWGWTPPVAAAEGVRRMVDAWKERRARPAAPRVAPPDLTPPLTPGVSAIIVTYRTGPSLPLTISRALADPAIVEVVLVDNGNDDETLSNLRALAAADPRIKLISGHGNVGFAAGCNIGASYARGEHLLLLNPDCLIEPGSVAELLAAAQRHAGDKRRPWVASLRLLDPDGGEQRGGRRNFATPWTLLVEGLDLWRLGRRQRLNLHEEPTPLDMASLPALSGAFMLTPRRDFMALRGMDERYFLHFEDLDYCLRLHRAGGESLFYPQRSCLHLKSTSDAPRMVVELHKSRSLRRYFRAHFSKTWPTLALDAVWGLLSAGLVLRALAQRSLRRSCSEDPLLIEALRRVEAEERARLAGQPPAGAP